MRLPALASVTAALLLTACEEPQSVLNPQSSRAERIADLWWVMLALGTAVFVVVMGFLVVALVRRRSQTADAPDGRADALLVIVGGAIVPAIVLVVLFVFTLRTMSALAEPEEPAGLVVEVVGYQWWWEVRYPEQGIVTANEIHIPAGEMVEFRVTTADVIHSFWVPRLQGKMDMVPGHTNTLWLEAEEPGIYRGQCAEFCGGPHALMALHVVADTPEQFAAWVARHQQPAGAPDDATEQRGQQVFFEAGCAGCHAIAGTEAAGQLGPSLTHLMSRDWIAAGTLPNNRGTLGGWVQDSQHIKPGNLMPEFDLAAEDLQALLAYLTSLE